MQHTTVKPPAAAARVPVATVSLYSWPGSRRWTWRSMKPGQTILPAASSTIAPGAVRLGPRRSMRSPASSTSWTASRELAGSTTRPLRTRRLMPRLSGRRPGGAARPCARPRLGDLIEDHRVGTVGDLRRELDAAIHRAGVHDEHVGPRLGAQL